MCANTSAPPKKNLSAFPCTCLSSFLHPLPVVLLRPHLPRLPPFHTYLFPRRVSGTDLTGQLPVESRRGNKYILITVFRGYIHFTPQKSRSASNYVSSFASILAFFTAHSQPLPSLIVDNETSLECREYFLSQQLPVTFVPPQTHRSNPAERAVRTGKNHLISVFSSTHPDFPDDLWDRLLPYAEITLNVLRPWRPDPTLSAWSGLHRLPYGFSVNPLHPPGQPCLAFSSPDHRAFTLGPALTPYPLPLPTCVCRLLPL